MFSLIKRQTEVPQPSTLWRSRGPTEAAIVETPRFSFAREFTCARPTAKQSLSRGCQDRTGVRDLYIMSGLLIPFLCS